jgi:hypothetical protein
MESGAPSHRQEQLQAQLHRSFEWVAADLCGLKVIYI